MLVILCGLTTIDDAGPHTQFYCDTCLACACTSLPVWLATYVHWQVNLTPGRRLLRANHWLRQVGCRATGPGQPILLSGGGPACKSVTVTAGCQLHSSHLSSCWLFLHWAWVCCHILASKASRAAAGLFQVRNRSPSLLCWGSAMAGGRGRLVLCRTYVTKLQVTKLNVCSSCFIPWNLSQLVVISTANLPVQPSCQVHDRFKQCLCTGILHSVHTLFIKVCTP